MVESPKISDKLKGIILLFMVRIGMVSYFMIAIWPVNSACFLLPKNKF
jgi:hypothetical protein